MALPIVDAAPPSQASVEHLLAVMHSSKLIDTMLHQIDGVMKNSMDQQLRAENASPAAQQIADRLRGRMMADLRGELSWEKIKGIYIEVYSQAFTQKEIDDLIGFYGSPTGQMVIEKMPEVMQKTQVMMLARMQPFMQHLRTDMEQSVREARAQAIAQAAAADAAGSSSGTPAAPTAGDATGGSSGPASK